MGKRREDFCIPNQIFSKGHMFSHMFSYSVTPMFFLFIYSEWDSAPKHPGKLNISFQQILADALGLTARFSAERSAG